VSAASSRCRSGGPDQPFLSVLLRHPSYWKIHFSKKQAKADLDSVDYSFVLSMVSPCFFIYIFLYFRRPTFARSSSLAAEQDDSKDFEDEIRKLQKEAEDRLDAKIAEMTSKIESTGSK
jgi:hypothetical protein